MKFDPETIGECLDRAAGWLHFGSHPERARPDAELLLRHVLDRDRAWLLAHRVDPAEPDLWPAYFEQIKRRMNGEPIQYILGKCEFYGLPFRVTPDVLIPRPETEHLVETAIRLAGNFPHPRIVDVGTGSGGIAVAIAHTLQSDRITGIDLSEAALAVARDNAAQNGVHVRLLRGDLLFPVADESFDLIVSNPPYIPTADRESLSVEVREHEPALALFAGVDGLDIYRRLVPEAFVQLNPDGYVALEIGFGQANAVGALLREAGFNNIAFTPDLQGIPRVASAQRCASPNLVPSTIPAG